MFRMKFALAEPGRQYNLNAYNPDRWADGLDYASRTVSTELALFRAARQHIVGLCIHLSGALDRVVVTSIGERDVRGGLKIVTGHAGHHVNQIWETRRVHGLAK